MAGAAISVAVLIALTLGVLGVFSYGVVAVLAAFAAVVVGVCVFDRSKPLLDRPAGALIVLAVCSIALNSHFTSEHVLTDRDPGVYLNVAVSLVAQQSLVQDPQTERFGGADVDFSSQGFQYYEDDDVVRPQFLHGLPAFVAVLDGLAGHRLALRAPALLGGVTIVAFGLLLRWLVPPWPATLGAATLGGLVVQFWISRDMYSEVLAQALLWLSLLLVMSVRDRLPVGTHDRRQLHALAVSAGLSMAALSVTRIEAPVLLPVLVVAGSVLRRRGADLGTWLAVVGLPLLGLALWLVDLLVIARPYWYLADDARKLTVASVISSGLLFAGHCAASRLELDAAWARRRHRVALAVSSLVPLLAVAGLLRSQLPPERRDRVDGGMQMIEAANGLAPEGLRTYAEQSVVWLTWYVGWPAFLVGVLGLAFLAHQAVAGSDRALPLLLAAGTLPLTLLYLWRPSAYPDHLWVMRRYITATLPLLVVGVALGVTLLSSKLAGRRRSIAAVALWGSVLTGVATTSAPLIRINPHDGQLGWITDVCDALPADSVVLVDTAESLHLVLPAPIRSFCRLPSAAVRNNSEASIRAAADAVRRRGGRPILLTADLSRRGSDEQTYTLRNERFQGFVLSKPTGLTTRSLAVAVVPL